VGVLSDHKRLGKRLVPPFVHMLGGINEVSWVRKGLPEYLWLALAHESLGDRSALEVVGSLVRICRQSRVDLEHHPFAASSSYVRVASSDAAGIRERLASDGALFELQGALRVLVAEYPSCPLRWLFSETPKSEGHASLERIRNVVSELYDRSGVLCTKIQATSVYLAFDAGMLNVREGLSLSNFSEIDGYPYTEISRRVAGAIRSTINMFLASEEFVPVSKWPSYFWNRSYALTPCEVKQPDDQ
jgi:hypothetical protein